MGIRAKFGIFAVVVVMLNGAVAHRFINTAASDYTREHNRATALDSAIRLANYLAPVVASGDRKSAGDVLAVMSYGGETSDAGIFDARGRPFVHMRRAPPDEGLCGRTTGDIDAALVWACAPVNYNGIRTGAVYIVRNSDISREQKQRVRAAALSVIPLFTGIIILALFWVLERVICSPLRRLTAVATMTGAGQFPPPALVTSNDELGALTRAFDAMVQKLRDAAITRSHLMAELRESRDAAEAGVRAKTEFLANMSHEIRTPMNGVLGMTQLLLASELTREQRENIETVRASAETLMRVVGDILDFSKIEARDLTLERVPLRVRECIEEVLRTVRPAANAKNLTLAWRAEPTVPEVVVGDPARFQQVLLHLVENAIKFTDRGGISVLSAAREYGREVEISLEVTDTGVGIAKEDRAGVFKPFQQGDGSMTRRYGGTGLGLALSKRLAQAMRGDISFRSEAGRGSTFLFSARFERPQQATTVSPDLALLRDALDGSEGRNDRGVRVLVVEDNPVNQKLILAFVERLGLSAVAVRNGAEAIIRFGDEAFGLVLMDCQMPVMDGYEAARRMRAMEQSRADGSHACIIAITANAMAGDRERCLAAGMDGYLAKPLRFEQFRRTIGKWIPAPGCPSGSGAAALKGERSSPSGKDPSAGGTVASEQVHRPV